MVFQKPEQATWLINLLVVLGAHVVVHIDKKCLPLFAKMIAQQSGREEVVFVSQPVVVNWAGFSQVKATLKGIEAALSAWPSVRFIHLMSGECMPLMSFDEMEKIIQADKSALDFIEIARKPQYDWRINRYLIFGESPKNRGRWHNLMFKRVRDVQSRFRPRSNIPRDEIYMGSQWWSLRVEVVRQILSLPNFDEFCRKFRWTRCADEHFFQILYARLGIDFPITNRRYIDFPLGAGSPRSLNLEEIVLARTTGHFFARKVPLEVAQDYWAGTGGLVGAT